MTERYVPTRALELRRLLAEALAALNKNEKKAA